MKINLLSFHKILILGLGAFFFSNCYFNPIINSLLNPESKSDNSSLALLAAAGNPSSLLATLQVSGQIKNSSGVVLENANIYLGSIQPSSSVKNNSITANTTTNNNGQFVIKLRPGIAFLTVTDANNSFLGGFSLVITSSSAEQGKEASPFTITDINIHSLDEVVNFPGSFSILSTNPADGAMDVSLSGGVITISYVFSKPVNTATLLSSNIDFKMEGSDAAKDVTYTGSGTNITLIFAGEYITANTNYAISPKAAVKDTEGNSLIPKTISIRTGNMP